MADPAPVAEGIAVVGMAGRFPGAENVADFWRNLLAGQDGITRFTDEDLAAAGYDPAALRTDPGFVPARGIINRPEWFDAAFFGIQPKEAEAIDPQQRVFMETAWHALEDAGCDPSRYAGLIGVYAGMSNNTYGRFVRARRELVDAVGELVVMMGNEKDYLTTRLAYKLNLRGPALSINTACSTSLVAIATACQSLASYQCDAALAGGVSITFPQTRGYFFREGGMTSPDGMCRPFDAQAAGAVFSHGCGVVVLKRLADALADGDQVYAVVKGWALNNDGAGKVSITAPSVDGQAEAIALAQALAGVNPESIGYVEAHGTGTAMGDPIEVAALAQVFGAGGGPRQFCALGSLKSNVGHLEAASGVAGFIKTALTLRDARIPATLHFAEANPELQLEESPFYVSAKTIEFPRGTEPRRAAVSSFGVGGTNAHAVLEEAPKMSATSPGRPAQLLTLSAKTSAALERAAQELADHLEAHPEIALADAAFTLQTGRQQFAQRRCVVAETASAAIVALRAEAKLTRKDDRRDTRVAFLFPGQGSQYPRMGAQLYASEPAFRAAFDTVADLLQPELGLDLRTAIFSGDAEELRQTRITQPAIFAVEYALARMWLSFGVQPAALLGHSVGEYVAATLAGVFALEDAARLVAARARLVQSLPGGAMLAARLGEAEAQEFVSADISIAAINSPRLCVLSGPAEAISALEALLAARDVPARRLATSHAFHSPMVAPVVAPFTDLVRAVPLRAPQIPFVSNITGDWISDAQATDPAYWASHVRAAVRFADGVGKLLDASGRALLEVGLGNALSQLARQHPGKTAAHEFAHTVAEGFDETTALASAQGRLWLAGVPLDWAGVHAGEIRRRVSLPCYPFERQRYFADLPAGTPIPLTAVAQDGEPLTTLAVGLAAGTPASLETPRLASESACVEAAASGLARLIALIKEQSGTDVSDADPATTLLDLGFDSLFLSQLIVVLQKRFGVRIALLDLFDDLGSLGALAAHLEKNMEALPVAASAIVFKAAPAQAEAASIASSEPRGPMPVAEAQRELWLASQRGPLANAAFSETCTTHFRGAFDVEAMRRALQEVVDRHATLRTIFSPDGETQIVQPRVDADLPLEDLSGLPEVERERRLKALQEAEGRRSLDLTRGPLFVARLVKLAPEHHALIFTAHHIACDGWSYNIVLRELGVIYSALREGRPHGLPAPMQMSDYQRWEREQQGSAAFAVDRSYWLDRFKTLPAPFDLPAGRARPAQRSYAGARECIILPPALHRGLAHLGSKFGATPFAVLLAAFKTLLFRLSGERDFVVGVPASGQNLVDGTDLIGHCVNLLAVRSTLEGTETFSEFLRTTRTGLFEAFDHQRFNFGQLVRHLPLPRDPGRVPLIASTFNLDPQVSDIRYDGLQHQTVLNPRAAYQFDFSFNCALEECGLQVNCDYNTDLFDAATIQRWLGHYRTLLAAIVAAPETPLSRLTLLEEDERNEVLALSRGPASHFPADTPLHALFAERAAQQPNAPAVVDDDEVVSYGEVERRANQVANHLIARGLSAGQFVALRGERSARFVWEAIGVLRAGGAYLPLHPEEPAERVHLVEQTCAVLLLDPAEYDDASSAPVQVSGDAGQPAYLLYTSGSTGLPKGVVVPHRAITRLVRNTNYVRFQPDDVVAFASNLSFDAATFEIWGALLNGARLLVTQSEQLLGPGGPAEHYQKHGVTVTFVTTALFNRFAREFPRIFADMRYVLFGGEMGDSTAVRTVLENGRPQHLVHCYGPTEATTFATTADLSTASVERLPIGRPIAHTDVFILDEAMQPVPIGVVGEIFIGGPGLAIGYHGDVEMTAQRFLQTPLGRLYKSGDRARWTSEAVIEILGRADRQIKMRGIRIEPGEIETHLQHFPHVRQAAVVPYRDQHGDLALAGYLVPQNGHQPPVEDVRHFLRERVAKALVPASLVWLPQLPLTANGKLDVSALPIPTASAEPGRDFTPPQNAVQSQLAAIWEEVLDRRPIGIRDDFFELGGHSLLAARTIALIVERTGKRLSFGEFFNQPTIEKHALSLGRASAPAAETPITTIHPDAPRTPVFFFHGDVLGGGIFCQTFAREIGEERPFCVLHPHGLQGDDIPPTIEAMAVERVKWLRKAQPHGPYILGGYCNGALLAYQVARVLRAAGEPVGLLLMLYADGSNVRFRSLQRLTAAAGALRGEDDEAQRRRFLKIRDLICEAEALRHHYARRVVDLMKQPRATQVRRVLRKARLILRHFAPRSWRSDRAPEAVRPASIRHHEAIMNRYDDICRAYLPGRCDAPIVLLWPQEEPAPSRGPATGWDRLCSELRVVSVPGDHASCVANSRTVEEIAAVIKKCILQAESLLSR